MGVMSFRIQQAAEGVLHSAGGRSVNVTLNRR